MSDRSQPWPVVVAPDGSGPAPEAVVVALSRVPRDMQPPEPVHIGVGWNAGDHDGPATLWIRELGYNSLTGVPIFLTDQEQLVEQIADQLQEQFFPETVGAWAQARPVCPGHPHPAAVELRSGEAWWRCPVSYGWISRVGSLHDQPEH